MIITALKTFRGKLNLANNPSLKNISPIEGVAFQLTMIPGQVTTVDDKFYSLASIQSAIAYGFINAVRQTVVHNFTDLNDVTNFYTGQANKLVKVKSDEKGLDFTVRLAVGKVAPSNPSIGDLWVDTN